MKIAFIGQKGIPHVQGGVEKHVEEMAVRLADRGHNVLVYTRPNHVSRKRTHFKGVTLKSLPTVPSKHLDAIVHTLLACLDVSFRRDIDIIHFHSIGPSSLIWLARLLNPHTPVVATFHSRCYLHDKWKWGAQKCLQFGEWSACRLSDRVIVISKILQQFVRERFNTKAIFIPNGVGMQHTNETNALEKWGLTADDYVLYVGRLVRTKRVHDLITAFHKTTTTKKLVIVGGHAFSDDYAAELIARAKNDPRIIFTGQQKSSVVAQLYSHAALFVLPSEVEGLSIALLEAFACQAPVLASDIIENRDLASARGFTFALGNQKELREKMQYLLDHPKAARAHCESAREHVYRHYQWTSIVEQTEQLYANAAAHKLHTAQHAAVKN